MVMSKRSMWRIDRTKASGALRSMIAVSLCEWDGGTPARWCPPRHTHRQNLPTLIRLLPPRVPRLAASRPPLRQRDLGTPRAVSDCVLVRRWGSACNQDRAGARCGRHRLLSAAECIFSWATATAMRSSRRRMGRAGGRYQRSLKLEYRTFWCTGDGQNEMLGSSLGCGEVTPLGRRWASLIYPAMAVLVKFKDEPPSALGKQCTASEVPGLPLWSTALRDEPCMNRAGLDMLSR